MKTYFKHFDRWSATCIKIKSFRNCKNEKTQPNNNNDKNKTHTTGTSKIFTLYRNSHQVNFAIILALRLQKQLIQIKINKFTISKWKKSVVFFFVVEIMDKKMPLLQRKWEKKQQKPIPLNLYSPNNTDNNQFEVTIFYLI